MKKTYIMYEKVSGKPLYELAKKTPINEDAYAWVERRRPDGAGDLDLHEWFVSSDGQLLEQPDQTQVFTADDVKTDAYHVIEASYPLWRQNNNMRRLYILNGKASLTDAEQAEKVKLEEGFAWLDRVRARSEELEGDIEAWQTAPNWPTPPSEV